MNYPTIRIGTWTRPEPEVVTNRYETAAWWQTVQVPAAELEVRADIRDGKHTYWVFVPGQDGIVLDEYFPSLFGGVPVGLPEKRLGPGRSQGLQLYDYWVAQDVATNPATRFRLDPRITITQHEYDAKEWKDGGWVPCKRILYGFDVSALLEAEVTA